MHLGHPDLCDLDETLLHQTAFPMRHAATSDVRFFDRYWLSAVDPAGSAALIAGIGCYKNTGSCDGYVAMQAGSRQYNARFARPLDDDRDAMTVGDVRIVVAEPFRTIRLTVDPVSSPLAADLTWTSSFPVHLEPHHFDAPAGRTMQDMTRYDQVGRWHGWIDYGEGRVEVDDWWGARDHSWGVRPGVGGFEKSHGDPSMTADMPTAPRQAMLHVVLFAEAGETFLALQYRENADGKRLALDGELVDRDGTRRRVGDLVLDIEFVVEPGKALLVDPVALGGQQRGEPFPALGREPRARSLLHAEPVRDGGSQQGGAHVLRAPQRTGQIVRLDPSFQPQQLQQRQLELVSILGHGRARHREPAPHRNKSSA